MSGREQMMMMMVRELKYFPHPSGISVMGGLTVVKWKVAIERDPISGYVGHEGLEFNLTPILNQYHLGFHQVQYSTVQLLLSRDRRLRSTALTDSSVEMVGVWWSSELECSAWLLKWIRYRIYFTPSPLRTWTKKAWWSKTPWKVTEALESLISKYVSTVDT